MGPQVLPPSLLRRNTEHMEEQMDFITSHLYVCALHDVYFKTEDSRLELSGMVSRYSRNHWSVLTSSVIPLECAYKQRHTIGV